MKSSGPKPRIKRGEHSFASPVQLEKLLRDAGFGIVDVQTVVQTIQFPSVLDYVRFSNRPVGVKRFQAIHR
jgi:hypothetical protein